MSDGERAHVRRFLDVTKAALFFARGVILVEGVSEQLLLPHFARIAGGSLADSGVTVINIGGVAFSHFARLFVDRALPIPCAILSDGDADPTVPDVGVAACVPTWTPASARTSSGTSCRNISNGSKSGPTGTGCPVACHQSVSPGRGTIALSSTSRSTGRRAATNGATNPPSDCPTTTRPVWSPITASTKSVYSASPARSSAHGRSIVTTACPCCLSSGAMGADLRVAVGRRPERGSHHVDRPGGPALRRERRHARVRRLRVELLADGPPIPDGRRVR
jgi:Overcoming lysogenization defect protein-like, TOPRIM domain